MPPSMRRLVDHPERAIATAGALSLVLLAVADAPAALRAPAFLAGGVYAPGRALVGVAVRGETTRLERVALAGAFGLVLLPVAALALSIPGLLAARPLSATLAAFTLAFLPWDRARGDAPAWSTPPSGPVATALAAGAILVAAIAAAPLLAPETTPPSLALVGPDGRSAGLPRSAPLHEGPTFKVQAIAGDAPARGLLRIVVEGPTGNETLLAHVNVTLAPGDFATRPFVLPTEMEGRHRLRATWSLERPLEVHGWYDVEASL